MPFYFMKKEGNNMNWTQKTFEQLTVNELYRILKERVAIFVVEQECAYLELDDQDQDATHLYLEENGDIMAYCRLLPKGSKYKEPSIGRVMVKHQYRKQGLAHQLMSKAVSIMKNEWDEPVIKLQAQSHLQHFYSQYGFEVVSEEYMDDGIPHVDMLFTNKEKS
jgi:ElaA protein